MPLVRRSRRLSIALAASAAGLVLCAVTYAAAGPTVHRTDTDLVDPLPAGVERLSDVTTCRDITLSTEDEQCIHIRKLVVRVQGRPAEETIAVLSSMYRSRGFILQTVYANNGRSDYGPLGTCGPFIFLGTTPVVNGQAIPDEVTPADHVGRSPRPTVSAQSPDSSTTTTTATTSPVAPAPPDPATPVTNPDGSPVETIATAPETTSESTIDSTVPETTIETVPPNAEAVSPEATTTVDPLTTTTVPPGDVVVGPETEPSTSIEPLISPTTDQVTIELDELAPGSVC